MRSGAWSRTCNSTAWSLLASTTSSESREVFRPASTSSCTTLTANVTRLNPWSETTKISVLLGEPEGLQCVEDTPDVPVVVVEHPETLR